MLNIFNYRLAGTALTALFTLSLVVGCGGSDVGNGVNVTGNVTLDGQPLDQGTVAFIGENGAAAAVGQITNGSFTLSQSANASGIEPGTYQVKVESWKVQPGAVQEDGSFAEGELAIPEKYTDAKTSGFSADVASDGGSFEFAMKSE